MTEPTPPRANTSHSFDLEQFRVHSTPEILRVLNDLVKSHELVTAYFNGGKDFMLSAVLAVDAEHKRLVLDSSTDERLNHRLLEAGRVLFATRHNKVRVQFSSERVLAVRYQGGTAFGIELPESIIRVQRREFYRLPAPLGQRLNLSLPDATGQYIHAQIIDISLSGVGLIEPPEGSELHWEPGTRINDCRIELPEEGVIEVGIEIRNRYPTGQAQGSEVYRIGCRLLQLDARQGNTLRRYIHRLEAERLRVRHD